MVIAWVSVGGLIFLQRWWRAKTTSIISIIAPCFRMEGGAHSENHQHRLSFGFSERTASIISISAAGVQKTGRFLIRSNKVWFDAALGKRASWSSVCHGDFLSFCRQMLRKRQQCGHNWRVLLDGRRPDGRGLTLLQSSDTKTTSIISIIAPCFRMEGGAQSENHQHRLSFGFSERTASIISISAAGVHKTGRFLIRSNKVWFDAVRQASIMITTASCCFLEILPKRQQCGHNWRVLLDGKRTEGRGQNHEHHQYHRSMLSDGGDTDSKNHQHRLSLGFWERTASIISIIAAWLKMASNGESNADDACFPNACWLFWQI